MGFGLFGLTVRLKEGRYLAVKARMGRDAQGRGLELEGYMLSELERLSSPSL